MRNEVMDAIQRSLPMLDIFKHIYLFGSVLDNDRIPNDIDILLIYDEYTDEIRKKSNHIKKMLEEEFELPVDLTVLSLNEEKEVDFLAKTHGICLK